MTGNEIDEILALLAKADNNYEPIQPFSSWHALGPDKRAWEPCVELAKQIGQAKANDLGRALKIVRRVAAVETGAIEGLYSLDTGITMTVAWQTETWKAAAEAKLGDHVPGIIESQLRAYDWLLDFATGSRTIAEAWIRELHSVICDGQETYKVLTPQGEQQLSLPKGQYKSQSNHVVTPERTVFSYAPVATTGPEMQRLCAELGSEMFVKANPVLQAAYAHYSFVRIHPFADGNGRVARALASVFILRAISVPILILASQRDDYVRALRSADDGDRAPFVDFLAKRTWESLRLAEQTLKRTKYEDVEDLAARIMQIYVTRGGYEPTEIDRAGEALVGAVQSAYQELGRELQAKAGIQVSTNLDKGKKKQVPVLHEGKRYTIGGTMLAGFGLKTRPPAQVTAIKTLKLEVPVAGELDDEVLLYDDDDRALRISAQLSELLPDSSESVRQRARIFADQILAMLLSQAEPLVEKKLKSEGLI